jgi:hypothetical protein
MPPPLLLLLLQITTSGFLRMDNTSMPATPMNGSGYLFNEQFTFFNTDDLNNTAEIQPNGTMYMMVRGCFGCPQGGSNGQLGRRALPGPRCLPGCGPAGQGVGQVQLKPSSGCSSWRSPEAQDQGGLGLNLTPPSAAAAASIAVQSKMTGKFCRFAPAMVMVPAAAPAADANTTSTNTTSTETAAPAGTPTIAFVLQCDQNTFATATIMTFTGTGLAYGANNVISLAMDVPIMMGTDPAAPAATMVFVVGEQRRSTCRVPGRVEGRTGCPAESSHARQLQWKAPLLKSGCA